MTVHPTQTYLDTLQLYFEEEIEGEAYFEAMAEAFQPGSARRALKLLAQVEQHAAQGVMPLISKYALTPRSTSTLRASGQTQARATSPDWPEMLAEMTESYPDYLDAFRKLEALGPPEDQAMLSFLSEHEVAAIEFLRRERNGDPNATDPLHRYLAVTPQDFAKVGQ